MSIRVDVNDAINKRLKTKLRNVKVENLLEPGSPKQSSNLSFFFQNSFADEPETIDYEEPFSQRQTLLYRCELKVCSRGEDKTSALVDRIQEALLGYQVLPRRREDEGFLFLVSDEVVEIDQSQGLLIHSIVVGVVHYIHVSPSP